MKEFWKLIFFFFLEVRILWTDLCFGLRFGIGECSNFELSSGGSFQMKFKVYLEVRSYVWERKIGNLNSKSDTNNVINLHFRQKVSIRLQYRVSVL